MRKTQVHLRKYYSQISFKNLSVQKVFKTLNLKVYTVISINPYFQKGFLFTGIESFLYLKVWNEQHYIKMSIENLQNNSQPLSVRKPEISQHFSGCAAHFQWLTETAKFDSKFRPSLCLSLHYTPLIEDYLVNFGKSTQKIHI